MLISTLVPLRAKTAFAEARTYTVCCINPKRSSCLRTLCPWRQHFELRTLAEGPQWPTLLQAERHVGRWRNCGYWHVRCIRVEDTTRLLDVGGVLQPTVTDRQHIHHQQRYVLFIRSPKAKRERVVFRLSLSAVELNQMVSCPLWILVSVCPVDVTKLPWYPVFRSLYQQHKPCGFFAEGVLGNAPSFILSHSCFAILHMSASKVSLFYRYLRQSRCIISL